MPDPERASAVLTIDLDALAANYGLLRDRVAGAECGAVVKADGYGLGADKVAARLYAEGCRQFFVAQLEEGAEIRPLVPDAAVYVFNGLLPAWARDYADNDVVPILNDPGQIAAWSDFCRANGPRGAAVHFDTGMTRLGLGAGDAQTLADDPAPLAPFSDVLVMSHLACADQPDHPLNARQLGAFQKIAKRFKAYPASFANSSGIFLGPDYHFDLVRPGYALYGGNPVPGQPNPMKNVVRLQGRILQLREIDTPRAVGYGATHQAAKRSRIATVAVGYADGYLRSLGNQAQCFFGDVAVPVIGRVSMDLITLDVSAAPRGEVRPGGLVDLISDSNPIDAVGERAGTIGYEILTSLGRRYCRRYLGEAA